jgi:uncharacterized protein (TIGR03066 family)
LVALVLCGLAVQGVHAVGDKKSAKELIVGKWRPSDVKELKGIKDAVIEFTKDGKLALTFTVDEDLAKKLGKNEMKMSGSYKFVEDDVVETKMKGDVTGGKEKTERIRVVVTDTTLTTTDLEGKDKGKKHDFKRVK